MPPSGVDYASEFLNGYAPEYVNEFLKQNLNNEELKKAVRYSTLFPVIIKHFWLVII
jgi:hypothetical protein